MTDLPTLLNAISTSQRTEQYSVLAALFALKAHIKPVAAKEVKKALQLHLRSKTPNNIHDCLSKARQYVHKAQDGPPIKWTLTQVGLDRLKLLSKLSLESTESKRDFKVDVGIICALEYPELSAVISAFGTQSAWSELRSTHLTHVYRESSFQTDAGTKLRIVATTSTSMGLTASAIVATQLVMEYRPRLVAMIGIAAGTRSGNKQFGDVLVADPSVDYASGKVVVENGIRGFQPDPYPIGLNARLRSVIQRYRNDSDLFVKIRKKWSGSTPKEPNRLHLGPVGAADQVIDDPSRVLEIQKNWRKLIGVEMETYGVYRAIHEAPEPKARAVSFKSVCDFAAEKSDNWQEYAAFVAAEFAAEFLRRDWESLWPGEV